MSIFPIYRLNVQRQRFPFLAVKRELREAGVQYALMFPARLTVMVDGNITFFKERKEAWDWLELYKKGQDGPKGAGAESRAPKRPRRRRNMQNQKTYRLTRSQAERDKKAAIEAAGSISTQKSAMESGGHI